jgi:hypothetical protein
MKKKNNYCSGAAEHDIDLNHFRNVTIQLLSSPTIYIICLIKHSFYVVLSDFSKREEDIIK